MRNPIPKHNAILRRPVAETINAVEKETPERTAKKRAVMIAEYKRIMQKKSTLSRMKRDLMVQYVNILVKKGEIKAEELI